MSLHCSRSHSSLNFRVHINTHAVDHHFTHFNFDNIQNASTLTFSDFLSHFQRNLSLFGRRDTTLTLIGSFLLMSLDLLLILANLSLLDILGKYSIVEFVRVFHGVLVVNFTTLWFHNITLLGISKVLEVVILALSEVLFKHGLVLNCCVLLFFETLVGRFMARQIVVIVIIHNCKEFFICRSISSALSDLLFLHDSIKLGLGIG
mmetsp:Transcript_14008/g.19008  ORF Transcript_14008/g.19008 Transcript_14008/m.19008 type:complete len:205 (+) Transcript_14008:534-1148(+)